MRLTSLRLLARQWHLIVLAGWSAVWFVILAHRGGIDWKFFTAGAALTFNGHAATVPGVANVSAPGGLHVFANYPSLQMGPLAYAVAAVLRYLGPHDGVVAAELALQAAGLFILYQVQRIALIVRPSLAGQQGRMRLVMLTGGAVFCVAWTELAAAFAHLDDGLALLLAVLAVRAALSGRPALAGLCVGLAADAKPWALVFVPVLFMFGRRDAARAWLALAAALAAAWLPFLLADPGTVDATRFTIRNLPTSALRALGVSTARTPPWDREAQVLLACALGALAIWRRRWAAILLLAGAARLVLDPATHSYYTPDVMVGALLWDLAGSSAPYPVCSLAAFAALNVAPLLTSDAALLGVLRLYLVVGLVLVVLVLPVGLAQATGSPPRQTRLGTSP